LKEQVDRAVSLMLSGSAFQAIGPATEKARRPNCVRRWRGTTSWYSSTQTSEIYCYQLRRYGQFPKVCIVHYWH